MAKFSWIQSVRTQFVKLPPVHHVDLTGQTVVVTGSNVGLGLETVRHFARMNPANLILAVRNQKKGDAAVAVIKQSTGYQGNLEVMIVDQNDFGSVSAFVTKFEQTHDRLDVLVLNAAVGTFDFEKSKDGWETSLQVNHLSTAMLSILLLPRMVETGKRFSTHPQITIVSSDLHFHATIVKKLQNESAILAKLNDPKYSTRSVMLGRYDDTKLLNVFLARGLTSRLPPTSSIVVDTVNPGFCHSDLRRNATWPLTWMFRLMELIMARKTEEGAKTIVWAALAGNDNAAVRENLRGAYTSECTILEASDDALSNEGEAVQKKIWDETIDIISAADPRVRTVLQGHLQ